MSLSRVIRDTRRVLRSRISGLRDGRGAPLPPKLSANTSTTISTPSYQGKPASNPSVHHKLSGRRDTPSVVESITRHAEALKKPTRELKAFNTTDPQTLHIFGEIVAGNPWLDGSSLYPTSERTGLYASKKIIISDIELAPVEYRQILARARKQSLAYKSFIGGPSAESAAVLASVLARNPSSLRFRVGNVSESNATHSSAQYHRRHASAINVDSNRAGHAMLPLFMKRFISPPKTPEILESSYVKIDLFAHNLSIGNIPIYIGNELHWAKNKLYHVIGKQTDHNTNVRMAIDDSDIADFLHRTTGADLLSSHKSSNHIGVHVVTSEKELKHLEKEHRELFAHTNVRYNRLTEEEMIQLFGEERHNITAAFRYEGDCMALYNAFNTYKEIAQNHGVDWRENVEVRGVFVEKGRDGTPHLVGIEFMDLKSKDLFFEPTVKAYLSLGYTNAYEYQEGVASKGLVRRTLDKVYASIPPHYDRPVPMHDTATGVSVNAIFEIDDKMQQILDENNGRYMETSVSNSHWTLVAIDGDKKHALMRMTAGGNMASEKYSPAYFLNLMQNTRLIHGDRLVGIVSTYGCPRSVNAKNSGEFIKICEGLVASYGHGGTGITKKNVTAAIALTMLGFEEEMTALHKDCPYLFANYDIKSVIMDHSERTKRRMGYDGDSFSKGEKVAAGFAMLCTMILAMDLLHSKDKSDEEEVKQKGHTDRIASEKESVSLPRL